MLGAREQRACGEITAEQWRAVEDRAITHIVKFQVDVGLQSITDGEFRRTYFHIGFLDQLGGVKTNISVAFRKPDGSEERALPTLRVVDKVRHVRAAPLRRLHYSRGGAQACGHEPGHAPVPRQLQDNRAFDLSRRFTSPADESSRKLPAPPARSRRIKRIEPQAGFV